MPLEYILMHIQSANRSTATENIASPAHNTCNESIPRRFSVILEHSLSSALATIDVLILYP